MTLPTRSAKRSLKAGRKLVIGWCSIPSPVTAELVARAGFDAVAVDLQHGLVDYGTALSMLQVIDAVSQPTFCRVPSSEPSLIGKALDAGFTGIICPLVNTREQAESLVSAGRYSPLGRRSFGPTRATLVHGATYFKDAPDLVTLVAMIETTEALANLEDILACEGLDAVYVGPSDLALSLGHTPALEPVVPEVKREIDRIRVAAHRRGKYAGIHCGSVEGVGRWLSEGFDFASLSTDVRLISTWLAAAAAK
jgi:4-hydroxy-2-oxoheptanedioate aldolase